jgi:hypothetical protein
MGGENKVSLQAAAAAIISDLKQLRRGLYQAFTKTIGNSNRTDVFTNFIASDYVRLPRIYFVIYPYTEPRFFGVARRSIFYLLGMQVMWPNYDQVFFVERTSSRCLSP